MNLRIRLVTLGYRLLAIGIVLFIVGLFLGYLGLIGWAIITLVNWVVSK